MSEFDMLRDTSRALFDLESGKGEWDNDMYPDNHEYRKHARIQAQAAIAAATPHIRAALFDELEEYISSRQGQDPIIAVMLARKYVRTLKENTQP